MTTPQVTARAGSRRKLRFAGTSLGPLLVLPLFLYLCIFFVIPLMNLVRESFTDPVSGGVGLANYTNFFATPPYVDILLRTFGTALFSTVLCAVVAYPYAYLMTLVSKRTLGLLLALVLVPFWTSMLARTYAWLVLLQDNGPIQEVLVPLGIEVTLLRNLTGVLIGMVQILLPFMVIPLYNSMVSIDRRLLNASYLLGASKVATFFKVFLPLSLPGLFAGSLIVYVISLGFYVTPAILGSPRDSLLSQLIVQEISQRLAWGSAAAMSVILIVLTLIFVAIAFRWVNLKSMITRE